MSDLEKLLQEVKRSKNAALVLGAGISIPMGIPGGYRLPLEFAETHTSLMAALGLEKALQKARSIGDWRAQAEFVEQLVETFCVELNLQRALSHWLSLYPHFAGPISDDYPFDKAFSDEHAIFVLAWLQDLFSHMITTNWDLLLEWHVAALHDQVYSGELFQSLQVKLKHGETCYLDPQQLFVLEPLDDDDFAWNSRWDIISNADDLDDVQPWSRIIWKIHGSPFLVACPKCGAWGRWKLSEDLEIGHPCPEHGDTALRPEIVFWGGGIDTAHPLVWHEVSRRLSTSDLIVVCGLSGSGSDVYIRDVIEGHDNAWVVSPNAGAWNSEQVNYLTANASDLAMALLPLLLSPPALLDIDARLTSP